MAQDDAVEEFAKRHALTETLELREDKCIALQGCESLEKQAFAAELLGFVHSLPLQQVRRCVVGESFEHFLLQLAFVDGSNLKVIRVYHIEFFAATLLVIVALTVEVGAVPEA